MFDEFDKTFGGVFPSPIGELHFSMNLKSYIQFSTLSFPSPIGELHFSILNIIKIAKIIIFRFRPLSGSYISQLVRKMLEGLQQIRFPSPIGELHFSIKDYLHKNHQQESFRPLSGSYISQYHLRNPMSCLGRIGGLRGKSNFIEMQPFWKVKNSHKSNI